MLQQGYNTIWDLLVRKAGSLPARFDLAFIFSGQLSPESGRPSRGRRARGVWVTALQLFFDLDVAAVPESPQVLSDLHGTAGRRQQVDEDLDAPLGHRRRIGQAEHLLQLDGEHGNCAGRVVQGNAPAAWNNQGRGGPLVKQTPLFPG